MSVCTAESASAFRVQIAESASVRVWIADIYTSACNSGGGGGVFVGKHIY